MKNENEQLEALHDIRKMMKESTRFLSLSGLSGVLAGIYALGGAILGQQAIRDFRANYQPGQEGSAVAHHQLQMRIMIICFSVLILSIVTAFYLSHKKAVKRGHKLFDHTSKKLLWRMVVPLFAGGIFCLALVQYGGGYILLVSPVMLLFYGLALISSSHLTLNDITYLGYLEVVLGLTACFFPGHGLLFWTLGFGVLHIIYGSIMWFRYDRHQ